MKNFERALIAEQLQRNHRHKPGRNISHNKWTLLQSFRSNDRYTTVAGDKNLGPCLLELHTYTLRGFQEHLGNPRNYKRITEAQALTRHRHLQYLLRDWIRRYCPRSATDPPSSHQYIQNEEVTFLIRSLQRHPDNIAKFCMICKVHKTPWVTRPIVCCFGTFMNCWSKWLDHWLQQLKGIVSSHVKDGQQILDKTQRLTIPPNAWLVSADAKAMYNNIDTLHAIEVLNW